MKEIEEQIELRICYTEGQITVEEKELRKVQDRIEYLKGELQGYKTLLEDINKMKVKELKNDSIEHN